MTELATDSLETRTRLHRRLVGLAVLLLVLFLLSLLLRRGATGTESLPSVVIPLNGGAMAVNPELSPRAAPVLGEPEAKAPVAESAQAPAVPRVQASAPVLDVPARPVPSKPLVAATPKVDKKPAVVPTKPAAPITAKPVAKPQTNKAPATVASPAAARWFVALGAYKDPLAAQAIAARVRLAGFKSDTVAVTAAGERLHRVRAGPFAVKGEAESARVTLIVEGLTKAAIVSEK